MKARQNKSNRREDKITVDTSNRADSKVELLELRAEYLVGLSFIQLVLSYNEI